MYLSTMDDWLAWIGTLHTTEIELGLERVREVARRLDVLQPSCPVVIVGGTNGKGSTVAALEALYSTMGYRVGSFTSPFLFTYNEQVRLNGVNASDEQFCAAFQQVKDALRGTTLTPFEFGTLAAMVMFKQQALDIWLLEVGLGGRLDAVNILDADLAVITSISLDHIEWLGDTRDKIGYEKAGIMRALRPAVCGDIDTPASIRDQADRLGTKLYCQGRDFGFAEREKEWSWWCDTVRYESLPLSRLALQNMSTALMAAHLLQDKLPVNREAIDKALSQVTVPGRIEVVAGSVTEIYDVAHNPGSVALLAQRLSLIPCQGKTYAVFSMLADKDMSSSVRSIQQHIDQWVVAPLQSKRAASLEKIIQTLDALAIKNVLAQRTIQEARQTAWQHAQPGDRIVIFGSFHTVAEAQQKGSKAC